MTPKEIRQHTTEIEIDATPDQVFRALTEAEQIVRWFAPHAKVEPGPDGNMVGGSYSVSWGPEMDAPSRITIWEPGRRFAAVKERSQPYGAPADASTDQPVHEIMVDYHIESAGGKTRLRLVHSGFGRGAGWDNEFDSTRSGWAIFLWILKHGLERHPGVDSATVFVMVPQPVPAEQVWRRLVSESSANLKPGDRYTLPQGYQGVVRTYDAPRMFGGSVDQLDDGLIGIYCDFGHGGAKFVNVTLVLWGAQRDRAKELEEAWTAEVGKALA